MTSSGTGPGAPQVPRSSTNGGTTSAQPTASSNAGPSMSQSNLNNIVSRTSCDTLAFIFATPHNSISSSFPKSFNLRLIRRASSNSEELHDSLTWFWKSELNLIVEMHQQPIVRRKCIPSTLIKSYLKAAKSTSVSYISQTSRLSLRKL